MKVPALPVTGRLLSAGAALTVTGPGGTRSIPFDSGSQIYAALIGGAIPLGDQPNLPLFLNSSTYTITAPGSADIGPFTAALTIPQTATWTNRDPLKTINRAQGATITWKGGDPARQVIGILGASLNVESGTGGVFLCFTPLGPGNFTVPPAILTSLPPNTSPDPTQSLGALLVGVIPLADAAKISARGLDSAQGFYISLNGITTTYR